MGWLGVIHTCIDTQTVDGGPVWCHTYKIYTYTYRHTQTNTNTNTNTNKKKIHTHTHTHTHTLTQWTVGGLGVMCYGQSKADARVAAHTHMYT